MHGSVLDLVTFQLMREISLRELKLYLLRSWIAGLVTMILRGGGNPLTQTSFDEIIAC